MSAANTIRILTTPADAWQKLAQIHTGILARALIHSVLLALVPAVCWYFGSTQVGWQVGIEGRHRLTHESALAICSLFYFAMIAGVFILGYMIHWMSQTFDATSSVAKGVLIVSYTATPFYIAGLLGLYPSLWVDISVGIVVACYCIYLLYLGIPAIMQVTPERGFLFASAVIAVALVAFVALMGTTVIMWDFGAEPIYTQ